MHIIDDTNYRQYADQTAERNGGELGLLPRDYSKIPLGEMPYTSPFAETFAIIPEKEWESRIKAMQGRFIKDLYTGTPAEDYQNGLRYCWSFSLSQAIKGARDVAGLPHVDLLAESLGRDVSWKNKGNYCGSAIECAAQYGFCDRSFSPKRFNLSPRTWKTGWEAEALNHRALEWWELGHVSMRQEVVTALLLGFGVYAGINRFGHAVTFMELRIVDGKLAAWTPNTHGEGQDWLLKNDVWIPDEAYVIRTGTWSQS